MPAFFNTFRGSKFDENAKVSVRYDDNAELAVKDILSKNSGTYSVIGCIKWFNSEHTIDTESGTKRLRGCILYDGTSHVILTIWQDLLDQEIK